jgi:hypothetical protein
MGRIEFAVERAKGGDLTDRREEEGAKGTRKEATGKSKHNNSEQRVRIT